MWCSSMCVLGGRRGWRIGDGGCGAGGDCLHTSAAERGVWLGTHGSQEKLDSPDLYNTFLSIPMLPHSMKSKDGF